MVRGVIKKQLTFKGRFIRGGGYRGLNTVFTVVTLSLHGANVSPAGIYLPQVDERDGP